MSFHYKNLWVLRRPKTAGNALKTAGTENLRRFSYPPDNSWSQTFAAVFWVIKPPENSGKNLRRLFSVANDLRLVDVVNLCGDQKPPEMW
jgi:hypothetical protein